MTEITFMQTIGMTTYSISYTNLRYIVASTLISQAMGTLLPDNPSEGKPDTKHIWAQLYITLITKVCCQCSPYRSIFTSVTVVGAVS